MCHGELNENPREALINSSAWFRVSDSNPNLFEVEHRTHHAQGVLKMPRGSALTPEEMDALASWYREVERRHGLKGRR